MAIKPLAGADLAVTKSVDNGAPDEGDTIQYTITITNNGPKETTGVEVTDDLPTGVTFDSVDSVSRGAYDAAADVWTVGALAAGDSAMLVINVTVDAGATALSPITNTATVTARDQADPDSANDSGSVDIIVGATISVTKTVDVSNPNEGGTIKYTIRVTNIGTTPVSGVAVTDFLPVGISFVSATASLGAYNAGTGIWAVGALAISDDESLEITATATGLADGVEITNTASADSNETDPVAASVGVTIVDVLPTITVDKTANPTSVDEPGGNVTFTVTVTNTSPESLDLTSLSDDIHGNLVGQGDCTLPQTITAGGNYTCSFTAAVNGNGGDTETDTVTATAQDDETNAVSESDSAAVTVSVVTIPPSVVNGFFNFGGPSPTATPTPQPTATPQPGQPGTEGGGNGGSGGTGGTVVTATPTPTPTPVVPPPTATTVPAPTATTVPAPTSVPPAPGATPVPAAQPEPSDGGGGAALPAAGIAGIILVVIAIMAAAIYYEVRRRYRLDDLLRG